MNKYFAGVIYIPSVPLNITPGPLKRSSVHVNLGACGNNFSAPKLKSVKNAEERELLKIDDSRDIS